MFSQSRPNLETAIYFADLGSYVGGELHGVWIDIDDFETPEELGKMVEAMLKPNHEEWAAHEYNDFPDLGEYPSFEEICLIAEAIKKHGTEEIKAYLDLIGGAEYYSDDGFEEAFQGIWDSEKDYAWHLAEETIFPSAGKNCACEALQRYFDIESYKRDLFSSDCTSSKTEKGVVVFWNH